MGNTPGGSSSGAFFAGAPHHCPAAVAHAHDQGQVLLRCLPPACVGLVFVCPVCHCVWTWGTAPGSAPEALCLFLGYRRSPAWQVKSSRGGAAGWAPPWAWGPRIPAGKAEDLWTEPRASAESRVRMKKTPSVASPKPRPHHAALTPPRAAPPSPAPRLPPPPPPPVPSLESSLQGRPPPRARCAPWSMHGASRASERA